jgi:hypothetical protein
MMACGTQCRSKYITGVVFQIFVNPVNFNQIAILLPVYRR